jgi:MFS family permease
MRLRFAVILGGVAFVTSFGAHVVAVNLPIYAREAGVGLAMVGLLIAVYDLAEVVAKPLFGFLADKTGMRRTMLLGIAFFIAASLLYLLVPPGLLIVGRFLQGVGAAALSAVSVALVGTYYVQDRGKAFGVYNAIKGAGYVLSPIVGGLVIMHASFGAIFVACAVVGGLAFGAALTLPDADSRTDLDDDDDLSWRALFSAVRDPTLRRWYGIIVVNMFLVGILFGFLPVRIHALHYPPTVTAALLSLTALSYLLVQPFAGGRADRADAAGTIRWGLAVSGAATLAIPFATGWLLGGACVLGGLSVGTVWTNSDAVVSRLARAGRLGTTMGVAGSFKEIGDMLGPALIGVLSQAFGLTAGFVTCGLLGLACALLVPSRGEAPAPIHD